MHDNPSEITAARIREEVAAAMREYRKQRYPKYPYDHRGYYQRNKKVINEKSRAYYQNNRERILARANERYAKRKEQAA